MAAALLAGPSSRCQMDWEVAGSDQPGELPLAMVPTRVFRQECSPDAQYRHNAHANDYTQHHIVDQSR